jgi:hypothetical protein
MLDVVIIIKSARARDVASAYYYVIIKSTQGRYL